MANVIRISTIAFWLLDVVRLLRLPVDFALYPKSRFEALTNSKMGDWSQHDRGVMLRELLDLGLIEMMDGDEWYRSTLVYGLTLTGGQVWEEIAQPKWTEYSEEICADVSDEFEEEESSAYSQLSLWHGPCDHLVVNHASKLYSDYDLEVTSVQAVKPWKISYWKTLDSGVLLTIRKIAREPDYIPCTPRNFDSTRVWRQFGFQDDSVYNISAFECVASTIWPKSLMNGWHWQSHVSDIKNRDERGSLG